ncbi:DUF2332 family protein [Salicibibacter cibi]|uniref:DUF2332 family protein n=1 Tax=Salicibibacter cibi TaxID=2743001 RepID=A0A7T7CEQ2_9BACI|nr:DUF2332 family protein [Salicibibacter cibi]QQK79293.1 DUF2332 family protein [Salicibibacter cibi]
MDKNMLSKRFKHFAVSQCVSKDNEMLSLCAHTRERQPVPNLFFGAVHYLLYKGKEHELKNFYGSIVESLEEEGDCFPYFTDFCRKYRNEIISIMENKFVVRCRERNPARYSDLHFSCPRGQSNAVSYET